MERVELVHAELNLGQGIVADVYIPEGATHTLRHIPLSELNENWLKAERIDGETRWRSYNSKHGVWVPIEESVLPKAYIQPIPYKKR